MSTMADNILEAVICEQFDSVRSLLTAEYVTLFTLSPLPGLFAASPSQNLPPSVTFAPVLLCSYASSLVPCGRRLLLASPFPLPHHTRSPSSVHSVDAFGDSLLHWAAHRKSLLLVRFLVLHGANVNARNHVRPPIAPFPSSAYPM